MRPSRQKAAPEVATAAQKDPEPRRRTTRTRVKTKLFSAEENQQTEQFAKTKKGVIATDGAEWVKEEEQPVRTIRLSESNYQRWEVLKAEADLTDDDLFVQLLLGGKLGESGTLLGGSAEVKTLRKEVNVPNVTDSLPTSGEASETATGTEEHGAGGEKDDKKPITAAKSRRRKQPKVAKEPAQVTPTKTGAKRKRAIKANVEEDPSEKILKRKRIGQYDCRKTPTGGIVQPSSSETVAEVRQPTEKGAQKAKRTVASVGNRFSLSSTWCRNCDCKHEDECPLGKPEVVVTDSVIDFSTKGNESASTSSSDPPESSSLDLSKSFAQLSLPSPLQLQEREVGQGLSVVARADIRALTQFGPLQGELILERDVPEEFHMKDLWQIFTPDNQRLYLSTVNPEKSNWVRYLRPAPSRKLRNVAAVVSSGEGGQHALHFITTKNLAKGEELLYWIDDPDLMWTRKRAEKKNCGGCNLRFSHPLYYRLHCTVFHDPQFSLTIRKYHCKVCGLAVLGKDNIVRHAQAEHGGKGAYQCQFCKKYFLRLNYLDMHRTYGCSSNPDRTRPKCDICGKKFCQPQKLKIHMKRMHSENGASSEHLDDVRCPVCSKVLGSRNALQRHRREVHSDLANSESNGSWVSSVGSGSVAGNGGNNGQDSSSARVACEKCGRTFKNKSNLKIHMLTHSGVKPFGCKLEGCKSGFTTKQCLQFHYRKAHGLTEEQMPKIEREIPYTLTAYSGGLMSPGAAAAVEDNNRMERDAAAGQHHEQCSSSSSNRSHKSEYCDTPLTTPLQPPPPPPAKKDYKAELKEGNDVYHFEDDEDKKDPQTEELRMMRTSGGETAVVATGGGGNCKASMLVVAALAAAEQDIMKGLDGSGSSRGQLSQQEEEEEEERPKLQDRQISSAGNESSSLLMREEDAYSVTSSAAAAAAAALSHSAQSLLSSSAVQPAKDFYRPAAVAAPNYDPLANAGSYIYPGFGGNTNPNTGYYPPYPRPPPTHADYLEDTSYRSSSSLAADTSFVSPHDGRGHYRPFLHHPKDPHHHQHHLHSYGQDPYPTHHGYPTSSSATSSYPTQSISPPRLHANHYHHHAHHPGVSRLPPPPPPTNPYHPYGYF